MTIFLSGISYVLFFIFFGYKNSAVRFCIKAAFPLPYVFVSKKKIWQFLFFHHKIRKEKG